jgi:hypothetical protein
LLEPLRSYNHIPRSTVSIFDPRVWQITYAYILSSNRKNDTFIEQRLDCVDRWGKYEEPHWQTSRIFVSYNKSVPHRGCALHDGTVSDDRLRRSEVFCAAALMAARLLRTGEHIVPVGIYILMTEMMLIMHERYSFTLSLCTRLV